MADKLSEESLKWDKMISLWGDFKLESPYEELVTYYNEVNNGGHYQFFDNICERTNLAQTIDNLLKVVPQCFKPFIEKAYEMYKQDPEDNEGNLSEYLDECDNYFYENVEKIEKRLQDYANTLSL